jgi:hypothetical protein
MAEGLLGRSTIFFFFLFSMVVNLGLGSFKKSSMITQKFGDRVEGLGGLYMQSSSAFEGDEGIGLRWTGRANLGILPHHHLKPHTSQLHRQGKFSSSSKEMHAVRQKPVAFVTGVAMPNNRQVVSVQSVKIKYAHGIAQPWKGDRSEDIYRRFRNADG